MSDWGSNFMDAFYGAQNLKLRKQEMELQKEEAKRRQKLVDLQTNEAQQKMDMLTDAQKQAALERKAISSGFQMNPAAGIAPTQYVPYDTQNPEMARRASTLLPDIDVATMTPEQMDAYNAQQVLVAPKDGGYVTTKYGQGLYQPLEGELAQTQTAAEVNKRNAEYLSRPTIAQQTTDIGLTKAGQIADLIKNNPRLYAAYVGDAANNYNPTTQATGLTSALSQNANLPEMGVKVAQNELEAQATPEALRQARTSIDAARLKSGMTNQYAQLGDKYYDVFTGQDVPEFSAKDSIAQVMGQAGGATKVPIAGGYSVLVKKPFRAGERFRANESEDDKDKGGNKPEPEPEPTVKPSSVTRRPARQAKTEGFFPSYWKNVKDFYGTTVPHYSDVAGNKALTAGANIMPALFGGEYSDIVPESQMPTTIGHVIQAKLQRGLPLTKEQQAYLDEYLRQNQQ